MRGVGNSGPKIYLLNLSAEGGGGGSSAQNKMKLLERDLSIFFITTDTNVCEYIHHEIIAHLIFP